MEDSEHGKRRWILYGVSVVYLGLAVLAGIACSRGINSGEFLEYIVSAGFAAISLMTFYAGRKAYRGGFWFIASTLLAALSVGFIYTSYDFYRKANTNTMAGGIILASLSMLLAALMFWLGHRRHLRIRRAPYFEAVSSLAATDTESAMHYGEIANDTPLQLYPPMQSWRLLLLMLLSSSLYTCFLMYRIARDLYELGERQLNPKHCAWQMLIPLYNFTVFLTVAKHVTRQAKASGIAVKVSSGTLMLMLILAYVGNFMLPDFLFLLSFSMITIPWMILNERMNQVRRCHAADWREPPNCYSWRQRFVLVVGAPIIVFALIGSRVGFAFYTADRLEAQQAVSGKSVAYQLIIPDPQWRQVALGTLYPDTDLELFNQQLNEWVVVRALPSQRQPLDSFVDQRKAIIAAEWKSYSVEETRAFLSASELIPLSLAQYTHTGATNSRESPLLVATLVTPDQVFEVIGHGSNKPGSRVTDLVKSIRLIGNEKKS